MEKEREKLVRSMRAVARREPRAHDAAYLGTISATLNVSTPELRRLARAWMRANQSLSNESVVKLCDGLFASSTHHEKAFAAIVLGYHGEARNAVTLKQLERWLSDLHGWAEIDSLCSNVFKAEEILGDWTRWKAMLLRLSHHGNINKRRASLVLLTGPARYSDDARVSGAAFTLIETLKAERDPLITKAISWLLRTLTIHHKTTVAAYIKANEASLPAIAVRETMTKMKTGTKSGKAAK